MCESDPELTRWGLHLLYDPVSCFSYENDSCVGGYGSEGNLGTDHTNVESAEVATYSLLEEFSQLATVEASGLSHASEEQAQISVLCQDWQGSTTRVFVSGIEATMICSMQFLHYSNLINLLILMQDVMGDRKMEMMWHPVHAQALRIFMR